MPVSVLPSILRTLVPLAVGYFLAWPAARWLGLTEEQVTSLITIVISAVYYLAVRALEQLAPQFGWLLGWASAPKYVHPSYEAEGVQLRPYMPPAEPERR